MTIDIFRPEIIQNIQQLLSLGLLTFGVIVHCYSCHTPYDNSKRKSCPDEDCGSTLTVEGQKKAMERLHKNVTEIFGDAGMPSCGGNNDEGGGGASIKLKNFFQKKTK